MVMVWYGDPEGIRRLARRLAREAAGMREDAAQVQRAVQAVPWQGVAADAMAAASRHRVAQLRHTADLYDEAAEQLADHARRVADRLALIAAIEQHVLGLLDRARSRVLDAAAGLLEALDPRDELLAAFRPPPSGSVEWLTVRLPVDLPFDLPLDVRGPR